jgi:hypothetical protein
MWVYQTETVAGQKKKPPDEGRRDGCIFPPPALSGSGSTVGLGISI